MYKLSNVSIGVLCIAFLILLYFVLATKNKIIVAIAMSLVGFASFGIFGLGYAYCSAITYPVNEATAGGLFQFPLNCFGFIMTIVCTAIINHWKDTNDGVFWSFVILVILSAIGTVSAAVMKPIPKDHDASIKLKESILLEEKSRLLEGSYHSKHDSSM
jgi:MFS family permease